MKRSPDLPKPPAPPAGDITRLLQEWNRGNEQALEMLIPLVYDELRRLAERHLRRERSGHTLQPTAVVHEVYLRLVDQKRVSWKNRGHFFAVAAQTMRRLLVDHARRHDAGKRGGAVTRVPLQEADGATPAREAEIVALDRALKRLGELDALQAKVVELRYFGGLTVEESADVLGTSASSVARAFRLAKMWLYRELSVA